MDDAMIRPAERADVDRMAEIVNAEPGDEPIALMGDVELARQYGIGLFKLDPIPNDLRVSVVAEEGDVVIGVLQYEFGDQGKPHSRADVLRMLLKLLGPFGLLRRIRAIQSRAKVDIAVPPGSFHICNLHIAPGYQDRGIGGRLLAWAESEAVELGAPRMTLITTTDHPRIAWYERSGYKIIQTATDATYERYTEIAGRVLMEKPLPTGA
jgi:ribosomal protein S18 acetylase RimI-like enzyme